MDNLVKCEICEKMFGRINSTHLLKHGISINEYRQIYPNAKLVSQNIIDICSIKKKEWHENKIWTDEDRFKIGRGNRGKKFSKDRRLTLSNSHKNRKPLSEESRKKISNSKIGIKRTDDVKKKLSDFRNGKTYEELYGDDFAKIVRKKVSNNSKIFGFQKNNSAFKGKKHRDDTKLKMRTSAIKQLQNKFRDGFVPNYNKRACSYFNDLMEKTNTFIQHAENGGEYYLENLGYWLDGYDIKNNIVYEFYEKRHFSKKQIEKDLNRKKEIIGELKCQFIVITEDEING